MVKFVSDSVRYKISGWSVPGPGRERHGLSRRTIALLHCRVSIFEIPSKDQSILGGGVSVQHCSPWRDITFGELFPRVGFIVTNLETGSQAVARFYNKRGMGSDHLGEGKCTERARLETTGCILSGAGTPKSEFRLSLAL